MVNDMDLYGIDFIYISAWWLSPTPLKNGVKVSWDDDIPNWMEK
jgi:hypothetical protein